MHFSRRNIGYDRNAPNKNRRDATLCTTVCGLDVGRNCGKTLLVKITAPGFSNKSLLAYAIIDEESTNSFATSWLLDYFSIESSKMDYNISTISNEKYEVTGRVVKSGLFVKGIYEETSHGLPKLYETNFLPNTLHEVATHEVVSKIPELSCYASHFPPINKNAHVCMLIGRDAGTLMRTRVLNDNVPVLHKTPIGYALVGNVCPNDNNAEIVTLRTTLSHDHFEAQVSFPNRSIFEKFDDDEDDGFSVEDRRFFDIIENNTIVNQDGSIEMPLPLKNGNMSVPDNCKQVFCRQANTMKQLKRSPDKLKECQKFMLNLIDQKHVELISPNDTRTAVGNTWYLPIFPVLHHKKLKLRLVFDSAASYSGISLNSMLLQGPDNNNKLRGVLARFREEKVAFVADVASMFHCFYVTPKDRDLLRFYWPRDNNMDNGLAAYRARVHIFGNCCSPSIATIGLRKAADSLKYESEENESLNLKVIDYIHHNFYVDDGLGCASTPEEAIEILTKSRNILAKFNIKLHKIMCNDPAVLKAFPKEDLGDSSTYVLENELIHRTLGVAWQMTADQFAIKVELPDRPFTKRGVLAIISSIYDPIGLACPVVLGGKLIQRKILPRKSEDDDYLSKYDWDDILPPELHQDWKSWKESLSDLHNLKLPRCLIPNTFQVKHSSINVFTDASENAIGHVIYLKSTDDMGRIHVAFLYGESKVAPKSANSIPRLELCAAANAANSSRKMINELSKKPDEVWFYSDSRIVLGYISNTKKRFSQYVTRRVQMVLSVSSPNQWRYVSTKNNPADFTTRATSANALLNSSWITGPSILSTKNHENHSVENDVSVDLPETVNLIHTNLVTVPENSPIGTLIERHSSWNKLKRIVNLVVKVTRNWMEKVNKVSCNQQENCAHDILIREAQSTSFVNMTNILQKGQLPANNPLSKLGLFTDNNGILRVGGRLKNVSSPCSVKYPILLPHNHRVSTLILDKVHMDTGHQGRHITSGALRQGGYYLNKGKKVLKSFLNKCVLCRRLRASCEQQYMSDLPHDRVDATPPFTNVGLDVFGHWFIHDGVKTRKSVASKKIWAVLFTCLYSRAVHIEPLPSLDTLSFQNALRRFISVRGPCKLIRSDRGTNFTATTKDVDFLKIAIFLEDKDCKWELNPPHASHYAGVWERKIGQVRRSMDAALLKTKERSLSRDELYTFLQEAANIVNSTPLWDVSNDPNDPEPMSPAILLTQKHSKEQSHDECFSEDDLLQYGKKRWRRVQFVAEHFWTEWRKNYLEELRARQKWVTKRTSLTVGDIVIMREPGLKRNQWPLGLIVNVYPSDDKIVRKVKIKVARNENSTTKTFFYLRPVSEVVLLFRRTDH